ncbi:MAG: ATP-binding cassette domain-containing protein [Bacteroidia bacterium]|nr:ATP-binding cassette domain-containing protein [Bacteroidia bacterium]
MSEKILEALMQLFAIVASVRGTHDMAERRKVVYHFLTEQLNNDLANKYITRFDEYYRNNVEQAQRSENHYKVISRISSRATRIAIEINRELSQYQKYIVLVQLYEYLNTGQISHTERGIVSDVVADKFNIPTSDFELIRDFILNTDSVVDRIIFSGDEDCETFTEPKYVFWEDLGGELPFVYLSAINVFIFKYYGIARTEMNGLNIEPGRTYILRPGNSIRNNAASPIFYNDMTKQVATLNNTTPITFEVRNVVYYFNPTAIGLHKFSFESESGRLVGIMGISGSGKSTLLNVISGMNKPTSGNVYINNIDIYENPNSIQGLIGLVAQDDILYEDLTVYENLLYSAKLSFGNLQQSSIIDRVNNILHQLGLWDIRNIKVGSPLNKKISGGQRKRLNIALELIREPPILILDEPTSGLSSQDSQNIIELLKDLTIRGKLIFVVIHQPSSDIFKMFDQLLVIDTGGYLIYDGNPLECLKYFKYSLHMIDSEDIECQECGNINVEQVLSLISTPIIDEYGNATDSRKITPEEWYEKFNWGDLDISYIGDPEPLPTTRFKVPNTIKQTLIYLQRDAKAKLANMQYILINLLETPILALLLASLIKYYNIGEEYTFASNGNIPVFFIMGIIIAFFVGLTVSAEEIIQDRPIQRRERFMNLSKKSYIVSKVIQTSILSVFQMLMFVLISSSILEIKEMHALQWVVFVSIAINANLIGLILSDTMRKTINIYIIIPFMVIPQLILSGVFVKFDRMNPKLSDSVSVPVYGNVIVARWGFEALAVNQFMYNKYENEFYIYHKQKSQSSYYKDYWEPQLRAKLNKALKYSSDPEKKQEVRDILRMIKNEIYSPSNSFKQMALPRAELFEPSFFGSAAHEAIRDYLSNVRRYNVQLFNHADKDEDKHRKNFTSEELQELHDKYANDAISEFVTNKASIATDVIVEYDGHLYQKTDQIFQDTNVAFKAQLFSPYKSIFGMRIDSYTFGVIMIWVQNILFYLCLLYNALPKIGEGAVQLVHTIRNLIKKNT